MLKKYLKYLLKINKLMCFKEYIIPTYRALPSNGRVVISCPRRVELLTLIGGGHQNSPRKNMNTKKRCSP